MPWQLEAMKDV